MEIVKKGDLDRLKKTRQFECTRCGCVFKAAHGEYESKQDTRNDIYYLCGWPTCGKTVYQSAE